MEDTPSLEVLIQDVGQLMSLPDVYYRLEQAIAHEHTSIDDIGKIISLDADLAARLLRVANSAFYGFPTRIESIARALSTIGTRELHEMVLATSVVRLFSRLPLGELSMHSFWRHSIFTGVQARVLAQALNEPNQERYYLAGLLHDIGRLVLYLKIPGSMHELMLRSETEHTLLFELEREVLGYDHAEVGGALLNLWRLPQALYEPVACHHSPLQAQAFPLEAAVIHLANWAACDQKQGTSGADSVIPPLNKSARKMVPLSAAELGDCIGVAISQFDDVAGAFMGD